MDAIKAIYFAVDHGLAKVLSNSTVLARGRPRSREAAIKDANSKGVLFVVAASNFAQWPHNHGGDNDNEDTFGRFPSAYKIPNVIAVSAVDSKDALASFSNFGAKTVHIAAPGVSIMSTLPMNKYGRLSGTSMATPHVAGAAALVLGHKDYKDFAPDKVKKALLDHVRTVGPLKGRCVSEGILDLSFLN